MRWWTLPMLAFLLAACSTAPKKPSSPATAHAGKSGSGTVYAPPRGAPCKDSYAPAREDPSKRGNYTAGGLYAPGVPDSTPDHVPNVDCIPEPLVDDEPRSPIGNQSPYVVLGKQYRVLDDVDGYVERGTASYYGSKFHGRLTSNREVYDMYAFTAAHKTLPLPSFARVTNLDNGQSVVVRVNDRGPFHDGRVIDLSYAAAVKLGITQRGTGRVEVRALTPATATRYAAAPKPAAPAAAPASGMDQLVKALPAVPASANALPAAPAATGAAPATAIAAPGAGDGAQPLRYQAQATPGQPASADNFDAWLRSRGMQIVGGKVVPAQGASTAATNSTAAVAQAAPRPATVVPAAAQVPPTSSAPLPVAPMPAAATAPAAAPAASPIQLQVASFSSRENADRALARLNAAGIDGASLSDIDSNGRKLWRVRVGAADPGAASTLSHRIAALGFGQPRAVND